MFSYKTIYCLLMLVLSSLCLAQSDEGRFEDADQITDFSLNPLFSFNSNSQQYDLRHTIPGEPEVDYPIYSKAPRTSFSCNKHHEGYYADTETRCQVFRICTNTDTTGEGFSFLCPNGTLFSQRNFVCDWYRNVDCNESESFYYKNADRGIGSKDDIMNQVKQMVEHPIKTITKVFARPTVSTDFNFSLKPFEKSPKIDFNLNVPKSKVQPTRRAFISTLSTPVTTTKRTPFEFKTTQKPTLTTVTKVQSRFNTTMGFNKKFNFESTTAAPFKPFTKTTTVTVNTSNLSPILPKGEIYVSSLGELSTDPGANFDPKNAKIIAEPASKQNMNFAAKVNAGLTDPEDINSADIIAPEYVRSLIPPKQKKPDLLLQPPLGAFPDLANNINGLIDELAFESKGIPQTVFPTSKSPRNLRVTNKSERPFKFLSRGFTRTPQTTQSLQQQLQQTTYQIPQLPQQQGLTNVPLALGQYPGTDLYYYYVPTAIPLTTVPSAIQQYGRRPQHSLSTESSEESSSSSDNISNEPTTPLLPYLEQVTLPMTTMTEEQPETVTTELPTATTTTAATNAQSNLETIPDIIVDQNDTIALEDINSQKLTDQHVHKRAEKLLLDGVQLTLLNDIENFLDKPEIIESTSNSSFYSYEPLLINVPDEPIKRTTLGTNLNKTEETTTVSNLTVELEPILTTTITKDATTESAIVNIQKFPKNILSRRQTAKPIVYTKKPANLRNYFKLTTTTKTPTTSKSRLIINRYSIGSGHSAGETLRRLAIRRSKEAFSNSESNDSDLTAVASTSYGTRTTNLNRIRLNDSYKYSTINKTRKTNNSHIRTPLSRRKSTTTEPTTTSTTHSTTNSPTLTISLPSTLITSSSTTFSPLNTELNSSSYKTFIPFDQLLRHAISDDKNLQINRNPQPIPQKQGPQSVAAPAKRIIQQASQPLGFPQAQQLVLSPYTQQFNLQGPSITYPQTAPQPLFTDFTQPKVVIAKSEEQTPFTITNDANPNSQRVPLTTSQSQYVPLDDFITQTLSTQIKQQALINGQGAVRQQAQPRSPQKVAQTKQQHSVPVPVSQRRVSSPSQQRQPPIKQQQTITSPQRVQSIATVSTQRQTGHHHSSIVQGQLQKKPQQKHIHSQQNQGSQQHKPGAQSVSHRTSQQQVTQSKTQNIAHRTQAVQQQPKAQQVQQRPINSKQSVIKQKKPKQHRTPTISSKPQPSVQQVSRSHQTSVQQSNSIQPGGVQQALQQNYAPQFYQQMTSHNYQPIEATQQVPSLTSDSISVKSQTETPVLLPDPSQFTGLSNIESNDINAQRRFDLDKGQNEEGSLFTGVTSYDVPINSIGRLPNDITHLLRRYRRH